MVKKDRHRTINVNGVTIALVKKCTFSGFGIIYLKSSEMLLLFSSMGLLSVHRPSFPSSLFMCFCTMLSLQGPFLSFMYWLWGFKAADRTPQSRQLFSGAVCCDSAAFLVDSLCLSSQCRLLSDSDVLPASRSLSLLLLLLRHSMMSDKTLFSEWKSSVLLLGHPPPESCCRVDALLFLLFFFFIQKKLSLPCKNET